jgi:2-polyprenyl-3-methyl-5-hydroxy-6-metoxy-1,4-benzoquinol methylase
VRAFKTETFRVWRCPRCKSIHSLKPVELDHYYAKYPFSRRKLDVWTSIALGNLLRPLIDAGLTRSSTLLDHGCSEGNFLELLQAKGYAHSFGFDPYSSRFKNPAVLSRTYDFVFSNDIIEHVEDPRAYLKNLTELTRPGGALVVGTPDASQIELTRNAPDLPHIVHQPYHIHILSREAMRMLGGELGLDTVRIYDFHYTDSFFPTVNWKFISTYMHAVDNTLDAAFDPPNPKMVLSSPKLLFYAFFGRLFPNRTEMIHVMRKAG